MPIKKSAMKRHQKIARMQRKGGYLGYGPSHGVSVEISKILRYREAGSECFDWQKRRKSGTSMVILHIH